MRNRRKSRILLMVLSAAFVLTACSGSYEDGAKALEDGDYQAAITAFESAVDENSNLPDAYRGLGIASYEAGDYAGAIEAFSKAIEAGTEKNCTLLNLMGCAYLQMDNGEEALKCFDTGLTLEDEEATTELKQEMEFNAIVACEKMQNTESVRKRVSEYLEKYPDDEKMVKEDLFLQTQ